MILKILVLVFAIWILLRLTASYREKRIDTFNFVVWSLIWLLVVVVVSHPYYTDKVARWVGVGRGTDIAFFVAFLLLFYLVFRLYVKITAIESDLTELAKHIALINHRLENKGGDGEKKKDKQKKEG